MIETNPLATIGLDHPLYGVITKLLDPKMAEFLDDRKGSNLSEVMPVDWNQLVTDYNELHVHEVMAFLHFGDTSSSVVSQAMIRRGLSRDTDFKIYSMAVLAIESMHMLGTAPSGEVPEGEFADYACLRGEIYPDPELHPNISEMDRVIPRRSNRKLTSDTLPIIGRLRQVYILKTSIAKASCLQNRGRPRKSQ